MTAPMQQKTFGFFGGGRITRILLEGRRRLGVWPPRVVVSDPDPVALAALTARFPQLEVCADQDAAAAATQDYVFLAVHPPMIPDVAAKVRPHLRPTTIVLSLAPKITLARLSGLLGGFQRLVRFLPNAPSLVNVGFNPLAFSAALSDADKQAVAEMCVAWGCCPQVVEDKLEAFALLTAMGPTYFWFQLYELKALAQSFGLTSAEAQLGLERLFIGLMRVLADPGLVPEEVKDLVPVKPLGEFEAAWTEAYRTRLTEVMQRIHP